MYARVSTRDHDQNPETQLLILREFAAREGRVLLTHDKRLIPFVLERIEARKRMPGVFVVHQQAPLGMVVGDLMDLALFSLEGEWEDQIVFVPLKAASER